MVYFETMIPLMTRRSLFILCAILALLALAAIAGLRYNRPTVLRVAVGQPESESARLVGAVAQSIAREKSGVRLRITSTNTTQEAAKLLDDGKVDLALTRDDILMPQNGKAVAIWQRNPLILVAPASAKITRWADLQNKTVGITGRYAGSNMRLFETALAEQGLRRAQVKAIEIGVNDVAKAIHNHSVDALFLVGPANARVTLDAVSALANAVSEEELVFVPIREADAIADRVTYFQSDEIVVGSVSVTPQRPSETVPTVSVTHYLLASNDLSDSKVSELTRLIFQARANLSSQNATALRIEAPDTEKSAYVPVHPGAVEYLTGSSKSFMELYSDYVYLAIFMASLGGSAFAGLAGYLGINTRRTLVSELQEVVDMIERARGARRNADLDLISAQADLFFVKTINRSTLPNFDPAEFTALSMALDHLRSVLADRHRALALHGESEDADAPVALDSITEQLADSGKTS
jgi:TRAP transporter TAXI family solute receptor